MDRLTDELPRQPEEGLLKVVVGLGRDVVVLQVLLAVEHDGLGLDLAVLDVDLVAAQHDGDVLADADQVAVPVGHVLVRHARGYVEHDDGALALRGERGRKFKRCGYVTSAKQHVAIAVRSCEHLRIVTPDRKLSFNRPNFFYKDISFVIWVNNSIPRL